MRKKNCLINGIHPVEWFDTNFTQKNKLIIQRDKPAEKNITPIIRLFSIDFAFLKIL